MIGLIAFGFWEFEVISRVIHGFGVGFMSVRVLQGVLRVFGVSQGAFFRGLRCSLSR